VVDEVEERVVEAEEREPMQRVAVWRLGAAHALDRRYEPLHLRGLERVLHDDEAVPLEVFPPHVAFLRARVLPRSRKGLERRGTACGAVIRTCRLRLRVRLNRPVEPPA
jgi:hypothetical protein